MVEENQVEPQQVTTEPQQVTKEPQGEAVQAQRVTTRRSAISNYKEPKEGRSW